MLQGLHKAINVASIIKGRRHGRMKRSNIVIGIQMRVNNGDITISNDPLWLLFEILEIDFIDDARKAVASSCTKNCFDLGVVDHLLKIFKPLMVCSRKGIELAVYRLLI